MKQSISVLVGLLVAVGLFAGLAIIPATSVHNAQATDDGGHHKKCKLPNGNDFPGRGPGGNCPPGLSRD
jgi:hypothetical protein